MGWTFVTTPVKQTFSRNLVMARGIVGTTTPVLFISQRLIHFYPPYGMVFHLHVHWLIQHITQNMFNTFLYDYQKP